MIVIEPKAFFIFFFFNDTATTEIYTLSLHDALPIFYERPVDKLAKSLVTLHANHPPQMRISVLQDRDRFWTSRSEEHTSELQSRLHLVCRLLLEKKKTNSAFPGSITCSRRRKYITSE